MGISRTTYDGSLRAWLRQVVVFGVVLALAGCAAPSMPEENRFGIPEMSVTEADRLVEIQLESRRADLLSRFPDAAFDDAPRIRFVTPEEWPEAIADCLTSMGFPASVSDGGGVETSYTEEQAEPNELAKYTCMAKYPVHPKYNQPPNEAQLEYLYDYYVNTLGPCLEAEGISVTPAPSLSTFLEADEVDRWYPYSSVDRFSPELEEKCPQVPDGIYG